MRRPTPSEQPLTRSERSARILDGIGVSGAPRRVGVIVIVGYLCVAAIGILIGLAVNDGQGWLFDEAGVMATISENRSGLLTDVAAAVGSFADTWTVIGAASGAVVVLSLARMGRQTLVLVGALALELTTFLTITYTVGRERPSVDATGAVPSTPSFPSGHVAVAVVLYGAMAVIVWSLATSRGLRLAASTVAIVVPTMVAASRVYEGLHHPTDVLAGALLGASCLIVAVVAAGLIPAAPTPNRPLSRQRRRPGSDTCGMDGSSVGEAPASATAPESARSVHFVEHIPRPSHVLLRSRALVVVTAAFGIALGSLATFHPEWLLTVDEPVAQAVRGDALVGFFRFWTQFGSQRTMVVAAVVLAILLWPSCRPFAVAMPVAILAGIVVDVTIKVVADRPRPPEALIGTALGSFPSGHALTGVIFFGLLPPALWISLRRRLLFWISVPLSVIVATLVAVSRVYLGGHWPSDVVASALLGAGILLFTERMLGSRSARRRCDGCPLHRSGLDHSAEGRADGEGGGEGEGGTD
jgi:membrane-associated phospholipid phosphatase